MKTSLFALCLLISTTGITQAAPEQKATEMLSGVVRKLASNDFLSYTCTLISKSSEGERTNLSQVSFHKSDTNTRMKGEFLISGADTGGDFLYYYPGGDHSFEARPANKRILRFTPGCFDAGPNNPALARTSLLALPDIFTAKNLIQKLLDGNPAIKISSDRTTISFAYPKDNHGMIVTKSFRISRADSCISDYSIKIDWLGRKSSKDFSFTKYSFKPFDLTAFQSLPQLQAFPIEDFPNPNASRENTARNIVGETISSFAFTNAQNIKVDINSFSGKYILLDFWETWCGYCIKDIPKLKALAETYKGKNFELVSLFNENVKEARRMMAINQVKYSTGYVETPVLKQLKISSRPTYILIDPAGKIISFEPGGLDKVTDILKQSITR